jgi:hypothetical protein
MVLSLLTSPVTVRFRSDVICSTPKLYFKAAALFQNNGSSQNKRFPALFPPPLASYPEFSGSLRLKIRSY